MRRQFGIVAAMATLLSALSFGQVPVGISPDPKLTFLNASGVPISGAKIHTKACGTSTDTPTYTDSTGLTPNANPVIADSAGRASIWLPGCVKFIVADAADATIYTIDNVNILPPWAVVTNPTGTQTISGATLQLNNNFTMVQNTAATGVANQSGNFFCQNASYWTGAASATDQWCWRPALGTGSNPTSTYALTHSGSSGVASIDLSSLPFSSNILFTDGNRTIGFSGAMTAARTLNLTATATMPANTTGNALQLDGGAGNGTGAGGAVSLNAGAAGANGAGGGVSITASSANSSGGAGGTINITAGNNGTLAGAGGNIALAAGNGTGTNSSGGNITLTPGTKTGAGTAGTVILNGNATFPEILYGFCSGTASATSTLGLVGFGGSSALTCTVTFNDPNFAPAMPSAGTLKNLRVVSSANGVNASSGVFTVMKNNVATAITCTVGTASSCADTTNSVSVAAGDRIGIQFTTQAAETLANLRAMVEKQ